MVGEDVDEISLSNAFKVKIFSAAKNGIHISKDNSTSRGVTQHATYQNTIYDHLSLVYLMSMD